MKRILLSTVMYFLLLAPPLSLGALSVSANASLAVSTCEYLDRIGDQCDSLMKADRYEEAQHLLGHALVMASASIDSCYQSSSLFSMLALIYEHQGDSIMPPHLHHKAQELAANYKAIHASADSADIIRQRMQTLWQFAENARPLFSRQNHAYLECINNLTVIMSYHGNALEVIHLGEHTLKLAADSMISDQLAAGECYLELLSAHAWVQHIDRVEELLPQALAFYRRWPQLKVSDSMVYGCIGQSIYDREDYAVALPYLQKAMKCLEDKKSEEYKHLKEMIKKCKQK